MSFIYDNTNLPAVKLDLRRMPANKDPLRWFQASDYNDIRSALVDTRTAITAGVYLGLAPQSSKPAGLTGCGFWVRTSDNHLFYFDGTTEHDITAGGGGGGSGTVTSVTAGTGLTGGTFTTSGTIAIDSTVATLTGSQTLTNKTLTAPVVNGLVTGAYQLGGTPTLSVDLALVDGGAAIGDPSHRLYGIATAQVVSGAGDMAVISSNPDSGTPKGISIGNTTKLNSNRKYLTIRNGIDGTDDAWYFKAGSASPSSLRVVEVATGSGLIRGNTTTAYLALQSSTNAEASLILNSGAGAYLDSATTVTLNGSGADGASALAVKIDTDTSWSNAGAKLLSIRSGGVEGGFFAMNTVTAGSLVLQAPNTTYLGFFDSGFNGFKIQSGLTTLRASGSDVATVDTALLRPATTLSAALGSPTYNWSSITGYVVNAYHPAVGIAQTAGVVVSNPTAAVSGSANQQYSPMMWLYGTRYSGSASKVVGYGWQAQSPGNGTDAGELALYSSYDGAATKTMTYGQDPVFGVGYMTLQDLVGSSQFSFFNSSRTGISANGPSQVFTYINGTASATTTATRISPVANFGLDLGTDSVSFSDAYLRTIKLPPIVAPSSPSSGWVFYVDSGDGNKLKAKASTGTVITLGVP